MEEPKPGERYIHFKGKDKTYEIIAVALNCNNLANKFVIYRSLYPTDAFPAGTVWSRSLDDFCGYKEQDGIKIKRFTKI